MTGQSKKKTSKPKRDEQDIILQQVRVVLAGEERTVAVKSLKDSKEFRRHLGKAMGNIGADILQALPEGVTDRAVSTGKIPNADMAAIVRMAGPLILGDGVDELIDLLWAYAPELREFETTSTDDEQIAAALAIMEAASPLLLRLWKQILAFLQARMLTAPAQ